MTGVIVRVAVLVDPQVDLAHLQAGAEVGAGVDPHPRVNAEEQDPPGAERGILKESRQGI